MGAAEKVFKQSVHITLFYPPTTNFSIVILLFCNPSSRGKSTSIEKKKTVVGVSALVSNNELFRVLSQNRGCVAI